MFPPYLGFWREDKEDEAATGTLAAPQWRLDLPRSSIIPAMPYFLSYNSKASL
jgi:hypothetical protein